MSRALLPDFQPLSQSGVCWLTRKLSPFRVTRSLQRASSARRFWSGASIKSQSSSSGSAALTNAGLTGSNCGVPGGGRLSGLATTRCRRIWAKAPGAFTTSPQGRTA